MKLWLVQRHDDDMSYDETHGGIVRATTEQDARGMMAGIGSSEGADIWFAPTTTCEVITGKGGAGILLVDFNAA